VVLFTGPVLGSFRAMQPLSPSLSARTSPADLATLAAGALLILALYRSAAGEEARR
jgi:hypothetical protein